MPMNTHYSPCMLPHRLLTFAQQASKILVGECKLDVPMTTDGHRPVLVYSGMSGIGMATGLAMHLHVNHPDFEFAQLYIRKPGESSHGLRIEMSANHVDEMASGSSAYRHFLNETCYPVLIDDCISSGATFGRIHQALERSSLNWSNSRWRALLEDGLYTRFNFRMNESLGTMFVEHEYNEAGEAKGSYSYDELFPTNVEE